MRFLLSQEFSYIHFAPAPESTKFSDHMARKISSSMDMTLNDALDFSFPNSRASLYEELTAYRYNGCKRR